MLDVIDSSQWVRPQNEPNLFKCREQKMCYNVPLLLHQNKRTHKNTYNINNSRYIKLVLWNTHSFSLARLITSSSGLLYNSLQIQSKSQTSPTNAFFSQNVNKLFYIPSGRDQSGLSTTYSPS